MTLTVAFDVTPTAPTAELRSGTVARVFRRHFEPLVRKILADRGIEIHRTTTGVRRTLPAVLAYYRSRGFSPRCVIDVGVGPGTRDLYEAFPTAELILIEPLYEWEADLRKIQNERAAQIVLAAAGREAGEIEIAAHRVPELSSTVGERPGDATSPAPRTVPRIRLDDELAARDVKGPFLLKVDVEGAELEVLRGAPNVLADSELVLLEVAFVEVIRGAPQLAEVVAWMDDHGFAVSDLYHGHNRPLDGALAHMDIAFVKTNGHFRLGSGYGTPAQNDALYRSWGR